MKSKKCKHCNRLIKKGTEAYYKGNSLHRKCFEIYKYQKLHPKIRKTFLDTIKQVKESK